MRCLPLAIAALNLAAQPAAAQSSQILAPAVDPHVLVYETLVALGDDGPMIEAVLDWMVAQIAGNPDIAQLAKDHSTLLGDLRTAMRPIIAGYSQRVKRDYRPRMIALLRSELTAADATEIAEFYASPIGRRLISGVSQSYRPDTVLDTINEERPVTTADVKRDMGSASQATLQSLSADEAETLYREIVARPAIARLAPVVPKLAALRAQMEEEPLTADEEAAIETALRGVFGSLPAKGKGY